MRTLTERDAVIDRMRGIDAGADDYLVKPISFGEPFARVRSPGRRDPGEQPTELQVADLRLDPAARRAWRGTVELELSSTEHALLRLFLNHQPSQVLTHAQILEQGWDYPDNSGSNVVDLHIDYLRSKIDRPFPVQQLDTVQGAGYRRSEEPPPVNGRGLPVGGR